MKIILTSGRATMGLRAEAKELELDRFGGYLLSFNGAFISDYKTKELYCELPLSKEDAYEVYDFAKEKQCAIMTYSVNDTIIYTDEMSVDNEYVLLEKSLIQFDIKICKDFKGELPHIVPKLLLVGEPDYLAGVELQAKEKFPHLSIYRSSPFFLEVMHAGIDKGSALKSFCDQQGIDMSDVIAFGDGYNDLSLVKVAGYGVAMANACDETKANADFITLSNDEDGIAEVIEKILK